MRLAAQIVIDLGPWYFTEMYNKCHSILNFYFLTVWLVCVLKHWLIFKTHDLSLIRFAAVDQCGQGDALGGGLQQVAKA